MTMSDLSVLLDEIDLATGRSEDVLDDDVVQHLQSIARRIRKRRGYLGEALVVAFAGGTGCGKSSLVNALVGAPVVPTGIVRPTTQVATAVFGELDRVDLTGLLDEIGVDIRIEHENVERLIIVDLPDFDSSEEAHRRVVEDVLPRVDVVIWVLDPEKYADPVLHDEFLSRLVPYEQQFGFVLNKVDRVAEHVEAVVESLRETLVRDGFSQPRVVPAVADGGLDVSPDIDGVHRLIEAASDTKRTATRKIAIDARDLATRGWQACSGVDRRNLGQQSLDRLALSSATFVSLGVAAYTVYASVDGSDRSARHDLV
jgi:GTP-binding protein EngB required for normal cell division